MYQRPFLKWPGGKFKLLDRILAHVKKPLTHWCEPFLGSGAVFLNVEAEHYTLADANTHLIQLYQLLKDEGDHFILEAKKFFQSKYNQPDTYYRLRRRFNETSCTRERSALFIYLNRHGFNGLCRYNQKGIFNVPFGSYKAPYFPQAEMQAFHRKAQRATFVCQDYKSFFEHADKDCMIYCDPPYVPLSDSAAFTQYASGGFSLLEQVTLTQWAKEKSQDGATVLVSNHDTPWVRSQYQDALIETFPVMRSIAASREGRKDVQELLALFLPPCVDIARSRADRRRGQYSTESV